MLIVTQKLILQPTHESEKYFSRKMIKIVSDIVSDIYGKAVVLFYFFHFWQNNPLSIIQNHQ